MISILIAGLIMGAVGSMHCIGMCGPIALSLPIVKNNSFSRFLGSLLYNLGRVITYSSLGIIFGLIGNSFILFGFQQGLSITLGIIILIIIIIPKSGISKFKMFDGFLKNVRGIIIQLFQKKSYSSLFLIGLLNGLLPCGLVYIAIAGAIATADPLNSALFMGAFGLGTLPLMWAIAFFGSELKFNYRLKIKRAYPYFMAVMACLLILRGMGLGIPYISPELHNSNAEHTSIICHD